MADYQTTHCLWFMHLNVVNSKHTTRNTTAKFFSCFDRKRKLIFFKSFGYVRISTYSYPTGLVNSGVNYMLRNTFTNWYTHKKNWIVYILRTKYTKKRHWNIQTLCTRCNIICDKVCHWLATGRWFSPGTPVSSTNKTDRHDIAKILLKIALNTI